MRGVGRGVGGGREGSSESATAAASAAVADKLANEAPTFFRGKAIFADSHQGGKTRKKETVYFCFVFSDLVFLRRNFVVTVCSENKTEKYETNRFVAKTTTTTTTTKQK